MELVMQYLKYLLEGLAVAAAAYYIPQRKTNLREVAMIALTAAATFAVLDLFAPAVAGGARQGAGFGIGARHVGFGEGFQTKEDFDGEEEPFTNEHEEFAGEEEPFNNELEEFGEEGGEEEEPFEVAGYNL